MRRFEKEYTKEISFPIGGIGSGSIGLGGNGRLMDWEIFNRPNKGSLNGYSHFAVRAVDGEGNITAKALVGDITKDLMGQYAKTRLSGYGHGVESFTMAGFPHFPQWNFESEFPFARVNFHADDFPADVTLKAFNPFIPMDADNSGIPAGFFEVQFRNTGNRELRFSAAFTVMRPFHGNNRKADVNGYPAVFMKSSADPATPDYRDMTLCCMNEGAEVQTHWYRGSQQKTVGVFPRDGLNVYWREFSEKAEMSPRNYDAPAPFDFCTVCSDIVIPANGTGSIRFLLSWNVPNCTAFWTPVRDGEGKDIVWKNYYAVLWRDSLASAAYSVQNMDSLEARSMRFAKAVYSSCIDPAVLNAAIANLCTLKTATVLRLEDGSVWGWEGLNEQIGSCSGTCSHVWNYAYALPFLFPELERSIRNNDYRYNQFDDGKMAIRMPLPAGKAMGEPLPCVDGQMGGVIKTYRDWKISGDTEWLKGLWPKVKKALEYAWLDDGIAAWDADRDGVLEGRQHNTLDVELFGPSAWLEGFYLAALKAAAEMADTLGESTDADRYRDLFRRGREWTEKNLFNGRYYIQKIDLEDRAPLDRFGAADIYWNDEHKEIKYQIGEGCGIDQLCAQWHADICGLGDIFDPQNRKTALRSMFEINHKTTLRNFSNPWRIYALQDESATVICEYPKGSRKPIIPVPYCEECFSGMEYALAGLMVAEGMTKEGLTLVRSVYDRNDGAKRNPFNEIECGSNYARAMSIWAMIPIYSGFRFDMVNHRMGFYPVFDGDVFRSFWSCGEAWGTVSIRKDHVTLKVEEGHLLLKEFGFDSSERTTQVLCDGADRKWTVGENGISFEKVQRIEKELNVQLG